MDTKNRELSFSEKLKLGRYNANSVPGEKDSSQSNTETLSSSSKQESTTSTVGGGSLDNGRDIQTDAIALKDHNKGLNINMSEENNQKTGKDAIRRGKNAGKQHNSSLGRGLSALFNTEVIANRDSDNENYGDAIVEINIDDIVPNRQQPRKAIDDDKLEELASSIKEKGVISPLIVSSEDGKNPPYTIVTGERRWRASRMIGLSTVPCIVRALTTSEMQQQALIENVVREDLNALEEAEAYDELISRHGITQETLARALGKSRPAITNSLRLLALSDEIKDDVRTKKITPGHARALLALANVEKQKRVVDKIKTHDLSVRDTEKLVKTILNTKKTVVTHRETPQNLHVRSVEKNMSAKLGRKVHIDSFGKGGKLTITFSSVADLEELIKILMQGETTDIHE